MRRVVLASLMLAGFNTARAQDAIYEYRPEIVLTLPRIRGFGLQALLEQHLETNNLTPNERIQGIGLSSPVLFEPISARLVMEARQVVTPTYAEHRYIPTLFTAIPLAGDFEVRNRTRVEIRDIDRVWSRRWQDRTAVGREMHLAGMPIWTYGQMDFSYDTRFSTINRIDKSVGARLTIAPNSSIDMFYTRQDDSRRQPQVLYATGAVLRIAM
jgi:hypothetical protein